LVQKREAEARLKEIEAEKKKPFARTRYLGYGAYFSFLYLLFVQLNVNLSNLLLRVFDVELFLLAGMTLSLTIC
jgi:hypothetical protein